MSHTQEILIPRPEADRASKVCAVPPGRDVERDETVLSWTAKFSDGLRIEVKVVAPNDPEQEACWCEAVMFDADGFEIGCSEPEERPYGEWGFSNDGKDYIVNVVAET